jgi:hypothetical protein
MNTVGTYLPPSNIMEPYIDLQVKNEPYILFTFDSETPKFSETLINSLRNGVSQHVSGLW